MFKPIPSSLSWLSLRVSTALPALPLASGLVVWCAVVVTGLAMPLTQANAQAVKVVAAASMASTSSTPSVTAAKTVATPSGDAMRVGVLYVAPPHIPGASPRTPEGVETAVIERITSDQNANVQSVMIGLADVTRVLTQRAVDLVLTTVPKGDKAGWNGAREVPTGYSFGAMAIMRSDTDIKNWQQLHGRTVCVAEGSWFAGMLTKHYGAVEINYKAPADSLIGLRVGECDAAVHDSRLLEEVIKFPEWKKFSARLPVVHEQRLVFAVPHDDQRAYEMARRAARQWKNADFQKLARQMAHNVAFEVYLDQDVPDCH